MLLKKIVIAEDDDPIALMVGMSLGDAGFLCLRAKDGDEAIGVVRRELPDLLILDLMLPKVDGIEVAKRLKADVRLSQVPILMLTALSDVEARVKGLEAGGDDYLGKPFDLRELVARVRALIRAARRERDRNPVTGLPGSSAIEDHVHDLIRRKQPFSLMYFDVNPFEAYIEAAGWRRAESIIAELGKLVLKSAGDDAGGFVGHLGGDDFVVVCQPAQANDLSARLVSSFDETISRLAEKDAPRLGVAVAIVDAPASGATTIEELSLVVAQTRRKAQDKTGSSVTRWDGPAD
jgi:PleD family two-component response regulator